MGNPGAQQQGGGLSLAEPCLPRSSARWARLWCAWQEGSRSLSCLTGDVWQFQSRSCFHLSSFVWHYLPVLSLGKCWPSRWDQQGLWERWDLHPFAVWSLLFRNLRRHLGSWPVVTGYFVSLG